MILKGSTHRVRVHVTRARLSGFWRRVCTYCTVLSSPYTPAAGNAGALKKSLSSKRRSPVTVSYVQYTCTPSTRPQTPAAARAAPIRHPTPRPPSRPVEGSSKPPEPHPVLADDEIRQKASGTTHRCQLGHVSSRMVNPLRSRQLSRSSWDGASRRHALAVPSRATVMVMVMVMVTVIVMVMVMVMCRVMSNRNTTYQACTRDVVRCSFELPLVHVRSKINGGRTNG
mmetsp:Transcript_46509/g.129632  ORF Transcript_46509/g.129632 Transcript_46509/m.129632 type:complete len:227 (-) Transcript_46509:32-712(-)